MLKVTGLVLILTAAVGTGYSISRELSLREKNLRQYLMLIISLKGEIRYGNSSLAEAFQRTVPRLQGPFRELAEQLAKELGSVEGIPVPGSEACVSDVPVIPDYLFHESSL